MKKIIVFAVALAAIALASCQKSPEEQVSEDLLDFRDRFEEALSDPSSDNLGDARDAFNDFIESVNRAGEHFSEEKAIREAEAEARKAERDALKEGEIVWYNPGTWFGAGDE